MEENKVKAKKHGSIGRFKVLDFIIIATVVLLVAVCVVLTVPKFQKMFLSDDTVQITYTVVFENVDESVYDLITLDQAVVNALDGSSLGTVALTPETVSYYEFILDKSSDGDYVAKKVALDSLGQNVTVTIRATARYNEGTGYTVDGCRIATGAELQLRFPNFVGTGYCNGVSVIDLGEE